MSKWDLIFSDSSSATILPCPTVTGPPSKLIMREPLDYPAVSKRLIAMLSAVPTARWALHPLAAGQGSGCKSSRIEFNANSHSETGTKNRFNADESPLFNGSLLRFNPSYS
jgi:hypothetical protein